MEFYFIIYKFKNTNKSIFSFDECKNVGLYITILTIYNFIYKSKL